MYGSSPLRSTLNAGYITGLEVCKVCTEAVHSAALWTCVQVQKNVIIPTPPHPTLSHVMCARVILGGKMMQNCACVYLWLQSVCAGDSGKWLCAHVTPVCVRGWLWVEKMMQNCACVYLWLQTVCAGDPLTALGGITCGILGCQLCYCTSTLPDDSGTKLYKIYKGPVFF